MTRSASKPFAFIFSRLGPRLCLAAYVVASVVSIFTWSGTGLLKPLTVAVEGHSVLLKTPATTVGQALAAAGIQLGPRDRVTPGALTRVEEGMKVEVRRARPLIFRLDGLAIRILTTALTIGEAIEQSRVPIGPDDRLHPDRAAPVVAGLEVLVRRVVRSCQHREEEIPFQTIRREDMTIDLGRTQVERYGQPGQQKRLLLVTYEEEREVALEELKREVVRAPVAEILRVGTAGTITRGGQNIRFLKALSMTATAYEPGPISCGASADGYTCLGLRATRGIVAVDPRVIPLWTRVYVDGYGFAVAGDTGSAIKGDRVDVCFDTYDEAVHWGVRHVKVYILKLPGS